MQTSIKRIGNSAGVLLSKPVMAHLQVSAGDTLEMELQEGRIVLTPTQRHAREGWAHAAQALANAGEGGAEWPELGAAADDDWTW